MPYDPPVPNIDENIDASQSVVVNYYRLGTLQRHQTDKMLQDIKNKILEKRRSEYDKQDCTFAPSITKSTASDLSFGRASGESEEGTVYSRLARHAQDRARRLEEKKRQKERDEEEEMKHCFKPVINRYRSGNENRHEVAVVDRLLDYGEKVNISLESKRLEKERFEEEELERKSWASHTKRTTESVASFNQRNLELQKRREQQWLEAEKQLRDRHHFAPKVCPTSSAIDYASKKETALSQVFPTASERGALLYYQHRAEKEFEEEARAAEQKMSPTPQTNPISSEWIRQSEHRLLFQQPFIERQQLYQEAKDYQQTLQKKKEASTTAAPKKTVSKDYVDRLYKEPLDKMKRREEQITQAKEQKLKEEYTFKPQLSPGTNFVLEKVPLREQNVVKRLTQKSNVQPSDGGEGVVSGVSESNPQVGSSGSGTVQPVDTIPKKVTTRAEAELFYRKQIDAEGAKRRRMTDLKRSEKAKELQECTFRPQTKRAVSVPPRQREAAAPTEAVVLGVHQYLMRQEAARRLKEEAKERERNIGRCNVGVQGHFTTLQPFRLKTSELEERKLKRTNSCLV